MAAQGPAIFSNMETWLTSPLQQFVDGSSAGLATYVMGPVKVGVLLYFVTFGVMVVLGKTDKPFGEFVFRCLKLTFLLMVLQPSWYQEHVSKFVLTDLPNELAKAVVNAGGSTAITSNAFDAMAAYGTGLAGTAVEGARAFTFSGWVQWTVIVLGTMIFTLVGFFVALYAKLGLTLLLGLGPIFIATFLFPQSRSIGDAWVKTLVSFVMLHVLAAGLGSMVIGIMENSFKTVSTLEMAGRVPYILIIFFVGTLMFGALPNIAQMLGGAGVGFAHASKGLAEAVEKFAGRQGRSAWGAMISGARASVSAGAESSGVRAQAQFNSSPQGRAMNEQTAALQEQAASLREMGELMRASSAAAPARSEAAG